MPQCHRCGDDADPGINRTSELGVKTYYCTQKCRVETDAFRCDECNETMLVIEVASYDGGQFHAMCFAEVYGAGN